MLLHLQIANLKNLARLEDTYGRFRSNVKISVAGAIEAQDAYAEILTICFGSRTAVLYKVSERVRQIITDGY